MYALGKCQTFFFIACVAGCSLANAESQVGRVPVYTLKREGAVVNKAGQSCGTGKLLFGPDPFSPYGQRQVARFVEMPGSDSPEGLEPGTYMAYALTHDGVPSLVLGEPLDTEGVGVVGFDVGGLDSMTADDLLKDLEKESPRWIEVRSALSVDSKRDQIVFGKSRASEGCAVASALNLQDVLRDDAAQGKGFHFLVLRVEGELDSRVHRRPALSGDSLKPSIGYITGHLAGEPVVASGVVVGRTPARVYVLTARHAVWQDTEGGLVTAEGVKVRFFDLPGESFTAHVLDVQDADLDLAVVALSPGQESLLGKTPVRFGGTSDLPPRTVVMSMSHPNGELWREAMTPERVVDVNSRFLSFESSVIGAGSSGGGLFNACGELVGVIVTDHAATARAVRIERVRELLRGWGIPFQSVDTPCDR
jgi:S1-C subfamily serine protease